MCQEAKPISVGDPCRQKVDAKILDRFDHVCEWTLPG
jgi:hypothetical protein